MSFDVKNFEEEVLERSYDVPVVVDFWAPWCSPCRVLGPVLEQLAAQSNNKWVLGKVNTEEQVEVARQFRVQGIPNVKLFVDGRVADEFVGTLPEHLVRRWLRKSIPSPYRRQVTEAQHLLLAGRSSDAQVLLEEVRQFEPENVEARVLLAQAVLFSDTTRAAELVQDVEEAELSELTDAIKTIERLGLISKNPSSLPPSPVRDRYLRAVFALFKRDFARALRDFIEVIRNDRYYDDDGSRKACIAIFKILGEEHETTLQYRRDFSSALYV